MSIARVRERGQLTLPLAVRVALGASTGSDLIFVPTGPGTFTLRKLDRPELLLDLLAHFASEDTPPDLHALRPGDDGWTPPFSPEGAP